MEQESKFPHKTLKHKSQELEEKKPKTSTLDSSEEKIQRDELERLLFKSCGSKNTFKTKSVSVNLWVWKTTVRRQQSFISESLRSEIVKTSQEQFGSSRPCLTCQFKVHRNHKRPQEIQETLQKHILRVLVGS